MERLIEIVDGSPLDLMTYHTFLQHVESGATTTFLGSVRDKNEGKSVSLLRFEAYEALAIKEMRRLADEAAAKWAIHKLVMVHATGDKVLGDPVVFIGVSTKHRAAAFEACRFLIDELKKQVPIWKKEFYANGSSWINAHP